MISTVMDLLSRIQRLTIGTTDVIAWGSPVPSFGNPGVSRVATLGLNPSNREFVDELGKELSGHSRRFHTLQSLGLSSWCSAKQKHADLILERCHGYFFRNPYDGWFKKLDRLISGTRASYYNVSASACHLDLIPYATMCKWTELSHSQRSTLFNVAGDVLGLLLRDSAIQILVLNGQSVVRSFQNMSGTQLRIQEMPQWALRRKAQPSVKGFSYSGAIRTLSGVSLGREVQVLGFNHNIQSSFGVTTEVVSSIRQWITRMHSRIES
jgi:hypothetical protein